MDGSSKLTYAQAKSIAATLHSAAAQMESILNLVKAQFNKIGTDGVWSGTAASDAKEKFDKLSAKFPEFSQAIEDCHKYLMQVVENYEAVDKAVMK